MTEKQKIEKAADDLLCKIMKDDPAKSFIMMLIQAGKICVAANAETMSISQESDIKKQRYKISCEITVKKL